MVILHTLGSEDHIQVALVVAWETARTELYKKRSKFTVQTNGNKTASIDTHGKSQYCLTSILHFCVQWKCMKKVFCL